MTISTMIQAFETEFGESPVYIIEAPGRVNLIGEHTDYNGLPVMPVSIANTTKALVSPRKDAHVHIADTTKKYDPSTFDIRPDIPHSPQGDWSNYVKAAADALSGHQGFSGVRWRGMNVLFEGSIPRSAGLSSSSAMVIASALSLLASNGIEMDPMELAELMAAGERYVGTQGGGMDQAVCMLGKRGHAVKIDFFPLRYEYIPFPDDHSILVANSLIRASKSKNALVQYNRRAAECRLATAFINGTYKPDTPLSLLGNLPGKDFFTASGTPEVSGTPGAFVEATFEQETYSLAEISSVTGLTETSLTDKYLLDRDGNPIPFVENGENEDGKFLLRKRARHILTEAGRVEKSCEVLRRGDAAGFGALMNLSHKSCSEDYEISTPELNTLTEIMCESGALGARLTGAGFGGCAVALVRDEVLGKCVDKICELYYNDYMGTMHPELLENRDIRKDIFAVKPSEGARINAL